MRVDASFLWATGSRQRATLWFRVNSPIGALECDDSSSLSEAVGVPCHGSDQMRERLTPAAADVFTCPWKRAQTLWAALIQKL